MKILTHVKEHPLLERVIEDNAQAIEQFTAEVESGDDDDPLNERVGRTIDLNRGEDSLDEARNGNGEEGHADREQLNQRKEAGVAKQVLRDSPNDLHIVGFKCDSRSAECGTLSKDNSVPFRIF